MEFPFDKTFSNHSAKDEKARENYVSFFRRMYPSLLFYACRFLDRDQAEDVVQDAFMDLWERRETIHMGEHIASFMYRSVYTKALNKLKHTNVVNNYSNAAKEIYVKRTQYFSADNNEVLKKIEGSELSREIDRVIESLPEKCREVFKLSYLHDLRNKQIADALGISLRTVEAHMYKALKLLRQKLGHLTASLAVIFTTISNTM